MSILFVRFECAGSTVLKSRLFLRQLQGSIYGCMKQRQQYSSLKVSHSSNCLHRRLSAYHHHCSTHQNHDYAFAEKAVSGAQAYFQYVHDITGLEWWAALALAVIPIRIAVTGVVFALQNNNMKKIEGYSSFLAQFNAKNMDKKFNTIEEKQKHQRKLMKQRDDFFKEKRVHPTKNFAYGIAAVPLWISGAIAVRNMSGSTVFSFLASGKKVDGFDTGGCLWFQNFLESDTTLLLPFLDWVTLMVVLEMSLSSTRQPHIISTLLIRSFQILASTAIYSLTDLPSVILYYWLLTSSTALFVNLVMRYPIFRPINSHLFPQTNTPIKDILQNTKYRYSVTNIKQKGSLLIKFIRKVAKTLVSK